MPWQVLPTQDSLASVHPWNSYKYQQPRKPQLRLASLNPIQRRQFPLLQKRLRPPHPQKHLQHWQHHQKMQQQYLPMALLQTVSWKGRCILTVLTGRTMYAHFLVLSLFIVCWLLLQNMGIWYFGKYVSYGVKLRMQRYISQAKKGKVKANPEVIKLFGTTSGRS